VLLDGLWVRLIRLDQALTQRRYACAVDVVIEVAALSAAMSWDPAPWSPTVF
jgi:hypothetical protein